MLNLFPTPLGLRSPSSRISITALPRGHVHQEPLMCGNKGGSNALITMHAIEKEPNPKGTDGMKNG